MCNDEIMILLDFVVLNYFSLQSEYELYQFFVKIRICKNLSRGHMVKLY